MTSLVRFTQRLEQSRIQCQSVKAAALVRRLWAAMHAFADSFDSGRPIVKLAWVGPARYFTIIVSDAFATLPFVSVAVAVAAYVPAAAYECDTAPGAVAPRSAD